MSSFNAQCVSWLTPLPIILARTALWSHVNVVLSKQVNVLTRINITS
jgi:hypothetical protein